MPDEKPRLRPDLQPVRAQVEERDVILLRDPLALSSEVIALGGGSVALLQLLDGTREKAELRLMAIQIDGGRLEAADDLETLLQVLDERCLLDNDNYREKRQVVVDDWNAQDERPAAFPGAAYPEEPAELTRFLGEIVDGAPETPYALPEGRLVALVVPHVDLGRGWPLYGAAYAVLSEHLSGADRIILMGTGHSMEQDLICPTAKHFTTPLGRAETDVTTVKTLGVTDDFAHRGEHSLEFQLVFLQHAYAEKLPPIVPILCGDATPHLASTERPSDMPDVAQPLAHMAHLLEEGAMAVAGVDLAHVGPKFGHDEPATELLEEAMKHETLLLQAIEQGAVESFWAEAARVSDRYRVCGLSTLGFLLEILPPGARGVLLGRDVMRDHSTRSAVGYAALAFFA